MSVCLQLRVIGLWQSVGIRGPLRGVWVLYEDIVLVSHCVEMHSIPLPQLSIPAH